MKILVTFTGYEDPYTDGLIEDTQQLGPILTLLGEKHIDKVILLGIPGLKTHTEMTENAILSRFPDIGLERLDVPIYDPSGYRDVYRHLKAVSQEILQKAPTAEWIVSVASGTPQMHAIWLCLAASGEFPAKVINVRAPRYATLEKPILSKENCSEVSLDSLFTEEKQSLVSEPLPTFLDEAARKIGCIGDHPLFRKALDIAATLAQHNTPIMIQGETGTGKDIIARLIHQLSDRSDNNFITINCATLPEPLVESILFGHERGDFTGASTRQLGKFIHANQGTLFLDELGELSMTIQAKLLRVIEDGIIDPLGPHKPVQVNVRIIASTNRDLQQEVIRGNFREDLFFRLKMGEIHLPTLRERRSDITKIAIYIIDRINASLKNPKRLSRESLAHLQKQAWPGNIRDLQNVIERAAMLTKNQVLEPSDLAVFDSSDGYLQEDPEDMTLHENFSLEDYLGDMRKKLIYQALEKSNGNQSEAARLLGISPQAVHKFLKTARA